MKLFILFLIVLPFILLDATIFLFPISLIIIFSVALISSSPNRFIFGFAAGFLLDVLSGIGLINTLFFLLIMGFIGFYVQYFPKNHLLNGFVLLLSEIIYYLLNKIPLSFYNLICGIIIFIPVYLLIYSFLIKDEETQLKFDFIRHEIF